MQAPPSSRNAPCFCGSGKRYKHCHGAAAAPPRRPDDAASLFEQGNAARARGRLDEAIAHFEHAHALAPMHVGLLNNLGLALEDAGRLVDAEQRFRSAHALAPDAFEPLANLAQNLYKQKHYRSALPFFDRIAARGDVPIAALHANRGVCHIHAGSADEAERSLRAALALEPNAGLYCDLGSLYARQKRFTEAAAAFESALTIAPGSDVAASWLLFCRLNLAEWRDHESLRARAMRAAAGGDESVVQSMSPFNLLVVCDDPGLQRAAAERWLRAKPGTGETPRARRHEGALRLGFVSFDFGHHPVGRLMVELLERLDRERFHVTLYALAPRDDAIGNRLRQAASCWRAFASLHAEQLADAIRHDGIDVLFDLAGFTGMPLTDVFLRRPSPMQVNFLGYTGTMGMHAYDWIVTDRHCIGIDDAVHYVERPLYVDPCYLPSDSTRRLAEAPSRADYGIADDAVVLCAHAATYKILPEVFGAWTGLLARHSGAVLWLRDAGEAVNAQLRRAANAHGIDEGRIAFAPIEAAARYLSRFRLADLFLDTAPFGAHTTVNDALFAGLPVVTIDGRSFAGRASASQVHAAGMGELVARNLDDYTRIADALIADPQRRRALAASLRAGTLPLFDMDRYVRRFGDAVLHAWHAQAQTA